MITEAAIAGHDSDLFSFLDREYIEQLTSHPSANSALWTFGQVVEGSLACVSAWNTNRFPLLEALVFTSRPSVKLEGLSNLYGGYCTGDPLICVSALTIVRDSFNNAHLAKLDDRRWITSAGDFGLERLSFIRSRVPIHEVRWASLKARYFRWCVDALDRVPIGLIEEEAAA